MMQSGISCSGKVEPAVLNRHLHIDDALGSIRERLVLSAVGAGAEGVEHHLDGVGEVHRWPVSELLCTSRHILRISEHKRHAMGGIEELGTLRDQWKQVNDRDEGQVVGWDGAR